MNKNENLITKTTKRVKGQWFEPFFEKIIEYKEKHGSFYGITQDKEIGAKVKIIRRSYSGKANYRLTQEMIEKLNSIGFPWKAEYRDWFGPFFEKLVAYKEKHGNFYGVTKDKEIGPTANNIRSAYKGIGSVKLTHEMIEKLNSIGFPWEVIHKDWFELFLEKLIAYKENHGDFYGVTQDKEIGSTVRNIRCAYKGMVSVKLTQEMIEKLEEIGFPWEADPKLAQDKKFNSFYEKLVKYKETRGSFYGVTQDKKFHTAVGHIRKLYKDKEWDKLTPEMIDKLNSIGFTWEAEYGEWFEPFFEKLVEYKKSHNGFDGATQDKEIGLKVSSIRKAYNGKGRYRLTPEMIEKLNSIGFPWVAQPKKFQENDLTV